ncbi:hypothetical protein CY34DRAFT_443496 [Suillus luteus UH-Slu-Lm8-n1]|uniref:Uncharacterized protein n=1 Tax=Suillus luteus UH-Slu-Lm8-n1 TaxID=930992 RepID=A0A0D0A7V8_9AGAM|nr:hypothetical protein CY34DRAFT_443496 [Suillus luteus UH-Slu-Lm8-n1]
MRLVFDRIMEPKMTRIPKLPSKFQTPCTGSTFLIFPHLLCEHSQRKSMRKRISSGKIEAIAAFRKAIVETYVDGQGGALTVTITITISRGHSGCS